MRDKEKLCQEIEKLEQRWNKLHEELSLIQAERDTETRSEEKIRLDGVLDNKQQELAELEQLIEDQKPADYHEIRHRVWVNRAYHCKQNGSYAEALDHWQQIRSVYPENREAEAAIQWLHELIARQQQIRDLIKQVMRRLKEIKPIYKQVIQRLQNLSESNTDQMLLDQVQAFVDGDIDGEDLMDSWELFAGNEEQAANMIHPTNTGQLKKQV